MDAGVGHRGDLRRGEASGMTGALCLAGGCDDTRQGADKCPTIEPERQEVRAALDAELVALAR